jgi:hypothetical protein
MKFQKHQLNRFKLLLTALFTAFIIIGASSTAAKEITNTATASGCRSSDIRADQNIRPRCRRTGRYGNLSACFKKHR